ncbi:MAG: ABC transporter permease [Cyclobacteriaceae bacterium]|nr:ABC transporter permease [Cyclobacteriaceae bacterium]
MLSFWDTLYRYRYLIAQLTWREIVAHYRSSALGLLWSFLNPLLMLVVYTFVFAVVFKARWSETSEMSESRVDFAIILFAGLIVFNLLASILNQSPNLILSNVNYVKKVIFPLELLPIVVLGSALFHTLISITVLLFVQVILKRYFPFTVIYLPFVLLPVLLIGLGASWFLSALTVYIRDVAHIIGVFTNILMFVSAVFFPISALPSQFQIVLLFNPIALMVQESRNVLVFGVAPSWFVLISTTLIGWMLAMTGYWWFQKARKGFADVL